MSWQGQWDGLGGLISGMKEKQLSELQEGIKALKAVNAAGQVERRNDALLTSKEIAPYLGVTHHKTVERMVREQGVPCVRFGRNLRFRLGDVRRWVAQRKEG